MNLLIELFITFFQIGLFTFGGGYAMLPMIQQQVLQHQWLPLSDLVNFIAVSESTPGPFAINISTYIGSTTGGFFGSFFATFGVVLPSFIVILLVAKSFQRFQHSKLVQGMMQGLRPTVVGLIAGACVTVGQSVFFAKQESFLTIIVSFGIFLIAIFCNHRKIHPIYIIILSGILGILTCLLFPNLLA